jgi:ribosomal-protein-alanine N-acetyltransferase
MLDAAQVRIETPRLLLTVPGPESAPVIAAFYRENHDFLTPYRAPGSDLRDEDGIRTRLERARAELAEDQALRLVFFERESGRMVGRCAFDQIVRGALQGCVLGYFLGEREQGRGYMTEALRGAIDYIWAELGLHRIEASYRPANERSGRVLKRLGFVVEGYARDYLFLDGAWQDHVRTALTNPRPTSPSRG